MHSISHVTVRMVCNAFDRTCSTGWLPEIDANDFKDTFIPGSVLVLVGLASRLQKKYSQVSLVGLQQLLLLSAQNICVCSGFLAFLALYFQVHFVRCHCCARTLTSH